jgi:hypothetical protein
MSTLSPKRWKAVSLYLDRAVGPEHPDTVKARKLLDTSEPSK